MVSPTTERDNSWIKGAAAPKVISRHASAGLSLFYGGPCGAGFCLAGSLGSRLSPPCGPPPIRVTTVGSGSLIEPRSIRKMRYPFFTRELRLGLQVLLFTSDQEVRHG